MPKNYMEYNDATAVLGTYANAIKAATPIEITYAQFQQLTPQQQETGNYIVTDWPGGGGETTPGQFVGTMAEWNALTSEEKNQYVLVDITDDGETGDVVDTITNGDMSPVTSNAVYDEIVTRVKRRSVTDLNDANTANSLEILTFSSGVTNSPNSNVSGIAISFGSQNASTGTGYVTQLAMANLDMKIYMRKLSSSTWSNWVSITLS